MVCKDIINEGDYFSCDNFKFNYKGCIIYGEIIKITSDAVIIKSLVSLGNPECKKYENIEIVLKKMTI